MELEKDSNGLCSMRSKEEEAALLKWTTDFLLSDKDGEENGCIRNNPCINQTRRVHVHDTTPISALRMINDNKPRMRWTHQLHDHFVDCIAQLGGPSKATPKRITRKMNVNGLTMFHVKSHLQKYRATVRENSKKSANTTISSQQHSSTNPYDVQSSGVGTDEMPFTQIPIQDGVERSVLIQEGAQEKYLESLEKRAFELYSTSRDCPRVSSFTQLPFATHPTCMESQGKYEGRFRVQNS